MSKHYEKNVLKSKLIIKIIKKNKNQNEVQTAKKRLLYRDVNIFDVVIEIINIKNFT